MKSLALITGASSGLGVEFARLHAQAGGDMVLVARREQPMQELKAELEKRHGVQVWVLAQDLSLPGAAQAVMQWLQSHDLEVDVLINNAGFGGHGLFHEQALQRSEQMMQLNMVTLTALTHACVQGMVERGHGKVLNVASMAGFLPGPLQAVYYATKAYVQSFSQALNNELRGKDVTVTALCPGPVDTGFVEAGNLQGVKSFDLAARADRVAKVGYAAMVAGKLLVFDNVLNAFVINYLLPLLPRAWVLAVSRMTMTKQSRGD